MIYVLLMLPLDIHLDRIFGLISGASTPKYCKDPQVVQIFQIHFCLPVTLHNRSASSCASLASSMGKCLGYLQ